VASTSALRRISMRASAQANTQVNSTRCAIGSGRARLYPCRRAPESCLRVARASTATGSVSAETGAAWTIASRYPSARVSCNDRRFLERSTDSRIMEAQ
jgi:hypothetical protein